MQSKLKVFVFGVAMAGLLYFAGRDAAEDGEAGGIQQCYSNGSEEAANDCDKRAAAFKERHGHAFNQQ